MSDRKIVDYKIINQITCVSTEDTVKELISEGFQPLGSPFCNEEGWLIQAMVKYGD